MRGNRVRVYFRYEGELCREPVPGAATAECVAQAERLAGMIRYEIKAGTFSYARHFPDSPRVKTNTFGHYIDLWLDIKRNQIAASGFRGYTSRVENHIRPRWAHVQADQIDHLDVQGWVQNGLMATLHNKTVREIVSNMRQIFRLYRTRNKTAHDPTDGIVISLPDAEAPDPFTRAELDTLLSTPSDRVQRDQLDPLHALEWPARE